MSTTNQLIKLIIAKSKHSKAEIARRLGVNRAYISNLSKSENMGFEQIGKLSKAAEVTVTVSIGSTIAHSTMERAVAIAENPLVYLPQAQRSQSYVANIIRALQSEAEKTK